MKRIVAIGDVHGCRREFEELLAKLAITADDEVWCLGDFMDKGPEPAACVKLARAHGLRSVLGNHDEKVARWAKNRARQAKDPTHKIKMHYSAEQRRQFDLLSEEDVAWLGALPLYATPAPSVVLVHGGLVPGAGSPAQQGAGVLRARWLDRDGKPVKTDLSAETDCPPDGRHWAEVYEGREVVVYGHHPHSLSRVRVNRNATGGSCYGIDTGCVFGGRLTALVLLEIAAEAEIVQVQAAAAYATPPWPIAT